MDEKARDMMAEAAEIAFAEDDRRAFRKLVALVVDDSPTERAVLKVMLGRWNFEVMEAADGTEALELCRRRAVDFVISDWMMPGMTGPELCRAIRRDGRQRYTYFILLTTKSASGEVAAGLDAGADDFVVKPTDMNELHARLRAGQRLIQMQEDLVDKNRRITEAFDRLNTLYESIERDLRAAARMQKALLPERQTRCGPVRIGRIYRPAGHVGGDLLGYFQATDSKIAAYSIDVSGHGISAALMTARLSNFFPPHHLDENIGMRRLPNGEYHARDPAAIAADLNGRLQDDADNDQYFTMLYAVVDTDTGLVRFCQAGHPNPAVLRRDGSVDFPGEGGAPIGLIPEMRYETTEIELKPGERLMLFSDGITECADPAGTMLENEGLAAILQSNRKLGERGTLSRVLEEMERHTDSTAFEDDVSALMLTMP